MTIQPTRRDPAALLKSTPPRAVRGFLVRERLKLARLELSGAHVTALVAPTGFGKTAQLSQWRREALALGAMVFWYTLDARDDPWRLLRGLAYSAQVGSGKRGFDESFMAWIEQCADPQEAVTGWLAEIAELSVEVLLLLDDVDLLGSDARVEVLAYLLGNAPPNLHVALAARPTGALTAAGTLSMARVTRVVASDLRFSVDETLAVLSATLGARCNPEAGVRLHELAEGWPLGVQLAVAALHRGGDLESLLAAATADIQRYFIDTLIDREGVDTTHLLVRLAQFDPLHPGLCSAVLGGDEAARELLRLQQETPLLLRAEGADWMRLHPVAREVLRERLARLPQTERQAMARSASVWYVDHGLFEAAADQAFVAGDFARAISLVEQTTHRMTVQGRSTAVVAWYQRLSPEEIRQRPAFWAPAAWALAMSDRHAEALPLVDLMLEHGGNDPAARFEAALIRTVAAGFVDRVDLILDHLAPWPAPPATARPDLTPIHAVSIAFTQIAQGHCEEARLVLARITKLDRNQAYSPVSYGFADFGTGLSYLWEGRCALAEQVLRPALARAEERMERRHPVACMLAALLLQACWDSGQSEELHTLLAGRMDVLDRLGLPDALMCAYRTLARIADHDGRQDQALDLLDSMRAIGQARVMPRLQALADYELVRLHARNGRPDMARQLSAQLCALISSPSPQVPPAYVPWVELHGELARAVAALANDDASRLPQALQAVESAGSLADRLKRSGNLVEARLLRAEVLRRKGSADARSVQAEALSLAQAQGMLRVLREHGEQQEAPPAAPPASNAAFVAQSAPTQGTGLLTTKEREVLALLTRNLSNKEIAMALGVSEQTVKWHMKNLFSKLNSANRKHAVARARGLGLVEG